MGLFDAYDPNSYAPGATQGGLLDRILANYTDALPQNVDASSPMNANAAVPAAAPAAPAPQRPQNAPIAVGNYSMPRIGSGFDLPPGQLDPDTGEHVAPAPAAAPVQPQAAMPSLLQPAPQDGVGDHLMTGFQNWQHGHNLVGSIVAAVTGKRNDPQAEAQATQQQLLQRQYQALVNAGVPHQQAVLAVLNPEAAKTIVANTFGPHNAENLGQGYIRDPLSGKVTRAYTPEQNDNFVTVQTGEDGLGKKTFSKMNKATGTMTPIAGAPGGDNSIGLGDPTKTGADYLATIPPQQAGIVKAMVEGRQAPPSSFALSKPYWQNMIAAAQQYDPTFDSTNWSGRVAGVKDFSAGKSSEMVRSANQTLQHVNALLDSADALHNGNYPSINWAGNKINEATGGGEPGAFKTNAHAVADEMSKVFKGGNLSDSEIRAWEENLSPNMSPAQQRAQIGKLSELLHGSLQALDEKRVSSIGQVAADKAGPIIKPAGQAVLQRIDQWLKAGNAAGGLPTGWSVQVH